jgi:hypothetical protein
MKLYYDMYVPYMPQGNIDKDGNIAPDDRIAAARHAMIQLANFQNTGDISYLYKSIISACAHCDADVIDILSTMTKVDIPSDVSIDYLLDDCANQLLRTIKHEELDIARYVAYISFTTHILAQMIAQANAQANNQSKESSNSSEDSSEDLDEAGMPLPSIPATE